MTKGLFIACTYKGAFEVGVTEEGLRTFASRWPCFGVQSSPVNWRGAVLLFSFDRSGDLTDVQGDEGLDGVGVAALAVDAYRHAVACYEVAP